MVVLRPQSAFGHGPPPASPYQIVSNIRGWDMLQQVRDGDPTPFRDLVNFYPRFRPLQFARTLSETIAKRLGLEHLSCLMYMDPYMWEHTSAHVCHQMRKEHAISPEKLTFRVVEIAGHRLYCVLYDPQYAKAVALSWNVPGKGISIRQAEFLLEHIDTFVEVPLRGIAPESLAPTWTPETSAHEQIRQRIINLLRHGAIDLSQVQCQSHDVFLYPTGMAAAFEAKMLLEAYLPEKTNVQLGFVFHNTHELLEETSKGGWKFFAKVDSDGLDVLETWLEDEAAHGRGVAFALVEFPSNPLVESVDLRRLKKLVRNSVSKASARAIRQPGLLTIKVQSEKFGFVLVVDDTVGSFSNVDVFPYSDMLLTSLTKSFNGRSDVLGGSIVLNPLSKHYAELSHRFGASHHNQLFAKDAETLFANSQDYFERSVRLNANAQAMAEFLHDSMAKVPDSPVKSVQYPSLLASKAKYDVHKRRSTPEFPHPGYGCLMTIEFESVLMAKTFYDRCGFYPSPHIGGHVTIMIAYNMLMFGRDKAKADIYRHFGVAEESVRISAGLENVDDLLDTLRDALDEAIRVKRGLRGREEGSMPVG